MVSTLVIVIAHFGRWINGRFGFDSYFFARSCSPTLVLDVVGWLDASAVVAFSDVDFFAATRNFDVYFGIGVALIARFAEAVRDPKSVNYTLKRVLVVIVCQRYDLDQ